MFQEESQKEISQKKTDLKKNNNNNFNFLQKTELYL